MQVAKNTLRASSHRSLAPKTPFILGQMVLGWVVLGAIFGLASSATQAQTPPAGYRGDPPIESLSSFPQSTLSVETASGPIQFNIWLADTAQRQQQGLMFVRDLPADQGMLFINDPPRPASFWMKNTYIALDLLFIDAQGRIVQIFENATPLSLRPIGVSTPVRAVLEIGGGESVRRGIRRGARVRHPVFD